MKVASKITVDLTRQNVGKRINAVQGDGNTRLVEITLLAGGKPWEPPEGVEAAIAYMQPSGAKGLYNKLADGTAAITIAGNVATIVLAPQMLTESRTVQASLAFNDQQLNRLTTFPFSVCVASNPSAGAQKVEDYIRLQWLEDKLEEYLAAIKASGEFDGKPGDNGVTFTPSVSENGDLSWRNNGGLPNPQTVNIRGPQGNSTAATAAANAAQTSAANAETNAANAAASAAAAQAAADAMGTELSQIKRDKLDKTPTTWPAWTADEQAAARERIGEQKYELLEEITLDGTEAQLMRDYTDNPYKKIMLKTEIPVTAVSMSVRYLLNDLYIVDSSSIGDSSYSYKHIARFELCNGLLTTLLIGNRGSDANRFNPVTSIRGVSYFLDRIDNIKLNITNSVENSKIYIYGVRA